MPDRRAITGAGTELVYWTWQGAGPPTLLLHGIGNYGRYWDLFADAVAGRLTLVAPDAGYENRLAFAFREENGGLVWRSDPAALGRIMSGRMPAEDRWDALSSIACPTLVVRGTRSNVLSEDVARQMVQTLADGRLMELDAGHNVPLDRPRELANAAVVLAT